MGSFALSGLEPGRETGVTMRSLPRGCSVLNPDFPLDTKTYHNFGDVYSGAARAVIFDALTQAVFSKRTNPDPVTIHRGTLLEKFGGEIQGFYSRRWL